MKRRTRNFANLSEPGFRKLTRGFRIKKSCLPKGRSGKARKARRKAYWPLGFGFLEDMFPVEYASVFSVNVSKHKRRRLKRFDAVHHTRGGSWKDGTLWAGNKEKAGDSNPSAL